MAELKFHGLAIMVCGFYWWNHIFSHHAVLGSRAVLRPWIFSCTKSWHKSVTHRVDAVDGGPCTQSLCRPLLSEACIQYKASKATCDLYAGQW